ncbi:MAG TPA: hypothetical protein VFT50_04135 [Baekduia sp.]|nr:hypothetical protein [Baekduia sp.]
MRRRLALIATSIAALVPASAAQAAFFPAEPVDGPNPGIVALGDVDVSRDGTGALAYVRRDGDASHVYVSRLVDGAFGAPEQVDVGLAPDSAQPVVAAGEGGRVAVVFISGGQAWASVRPSALQAWTAPQPLGAGASNPSVDLSVNGVGYATFTSSGDVRAARLDRGATSFAVLGQPLDIDPAQDAGAGAGRSRVAVSADGTAVAVWGEAGHAYARRLFATSVSASPLDLSLPSLDGHAGLAADAPDVDIEDDSSFAWIVFRQAFDDGGVPITRAIATRLRGSRLDGEAPYDGLAWGGGAGAEAPSVDINGKGLGIVTAGTTSGAALSGIIKDDLLNTAIQVGGNGSPAQPRGAVAEGTARVAGWVNAGDGTAYGAFYQDRLEDRTVPTPDPAALLSRPELGPVDPAAGFDMSGDRTGDFAFAFVQGTGADRRLVVSYYDRAPVSFFLQSSSRPWRNPERDPISWTAPVDQWGTMSYAILVDGKPLAKTTKTRAKLPAGSLPQGIHRFAIQGTDRRGQSATTRSVRLKVDTLEPRLAVHVSRSGRMLTVHARARDRVAGARPSGIATTRIAFGDHSRSVTGSKAVHVYARGGRFRVRVKAVDAAGNRTVVRRTVHVG